jgi:hypothetical protein
VTVADSPRVLEYTWGDGILRWELEPVGDGTRLTLQHTIPDETFLSKVAAGWHICLVVAEYFMDGTPVGPIVGERALEYGWEQLNDSYAELLQVPNTGWPQQASPKRFAPISNSRNFRNLCRTLSISVQVSRLSDNSSCSTDQIQEQDREIRTLDRSSSSGRVVRVWWSRKAGYAD